MRSKFTGLITLVLALVLGGCATSGAYTKADKRQAILSMKSEVLTELYRSKPGARRQVDEVRKPNHPALRTADQRGPASFLG